MGEKKLDDEILTSEELAAEWKCSKRFLEEARAKYGLPFFKIGRLVRYRRSMITPWFEKRLQVS